jgi:hypothetical protein
VDDECRYFHYARGSYADDPAPDRGCSVWDFPNPRRFDAEADRDIDRMIDAFRDASVPVDYFLIEYTDDGRVGRQSRFSIAYCNTLTYEADYSPLWLEPGEDELRAAISADWYETAC